MPDMLVKLYKLPETNELYKKLEDNGIVIMRPMTPNKTKVVEWVREHFSDGWADEISAAFTKFPVSCFIAYDVNEKKMLGFAGYDCTYRDFFGPTGVDATQRGRGIGKMVMQTVIARLQELGFAKITGSTVYQWNTSSQKLHEGLGFCKVSEDEKEIVYERSL